MADIPVPHDIPLKRNDTFKHVIKGVYDNLGVLMNWTSITARMQARESRGANPVIDISSPTFIDLSVNGQISLYIDEADTDIIAGKYAYDIEFTKSGDTITGIGGTLQVYDDITHD